MTTPPRFPVQPWQLGGSRRLATRMPLEHLDDMVRLDLYYAEHWSAWLDFKIMLRTAPAVIAGRGAY